jgi:hypothetical protein
VFENLEQVAVRRCSESVAEIVDWFINDKQSFKNPAIVDWNRIIPLGTK